MTVIDLPQDLRDRVIIVTGAGTAEGVGNGQAMATTAARRGAHVVCADLYPERAEAAAAAIRAEGYSAAATGANVTVPDDCDGLAAFAVSEFGRIDGLVNNVGVVSVNGLASRVDGGALGELEALDLDDWNFVFQTNVTSAMLCTRAVYPEMRKRGEGAIVNIGSTMGYRWYGGVGSLAYTTAKSALEGLTLSTAGALGDFGIRVNLLVIGQVRAPHIDRAAAAMGDAGLEMLEHRRTSGLVHYDASPWDVADTAAYLLGPTARWVTAQTIFVDAGANKTMR